MAITTPDDRHDALRATLAGLLALDEPRRHVAAMLTGLDIHYDLGDGHPLLGRRMPDLDLDTADGPTRLYTQMHDARPILLNLGRPGRFNLGEFTYSVKLVDATHVGTCELPLIGEIDVPTAVLIRPDGHVAWVAADDDDDEGPTLPQALTTWFGALRPPPA